LKTVDRESAGRKSEYLASASRGNEDRANVKSKTVALALAIRGIRAVLVMLAM